MFHSVYDENWEGLFSHLYSSISCLVGAVACGLFGGLLLHRWRVDEGTVGLLATGDDFTGQRAARARVLICIMVSLSSLFCLLPSAVRSVVRLTRTEEGGRECCHIQLYSTQQQVSSCLVWFHYWCAECCMALRACSTRVVSVSLWALFFSLFSFSFFFFFFSFSFTGSPCFRVFALCWWSDGGRGDCSFSGVKCVAETRW